MHQGDGGDGSGAGRQVLSCESEALQILPLTDLHLTPSRALSDS